MLSGSKDEMWFLQTILLFDILASDENMQEHFSMQRTESVM